MQPMLSLFFTMAKISLSCFGGGYAILPLLEREFIHKRNAITQHDLQNIIAVAQSTPGIISLNASTYIGTKLHGFVGALFASLGMLFPPICIVSLLSYLLSSYAFLVWVEHALAGLRICVTILIWQAVFRLFKSSVLNIPTFVLFSAVLLTAFLFHISPALLLFSSGLLGFLVSFIQKQRRQN